MENLGVYLEKLSVRAAREGLGHDGVKALVEQELLPEQQEEFLREYFGHGPLDPLFSSPEITEILVNGPDSIWVERGGALEFTGKRFCSSYSLERYARRLLLESGRRVDRKCPFADARLSDGSRLCVAIEPAVRGGMHLSIRKFQRERHSLGAMAASGYLSGRARAFLAESVAKGKNIFISGGTGSGKTTLLNALAAEVPLHQRILTLEDIAELQITHPHVVQLEARPANAEGEGEIDIRTLLRRALRMRPDRLILGECRGGEALDLLQALNTGHHGSMGTIHANSPRDALARLEVLSLLEGKNLNPESVRQYISSAVQVIVHLEKWDFQRRVHSIHELRGVQDGIYLLRPCEL